MNNPNGNRSMLLGVVGGYLIYLAYDMFRSLRAGEPTSMPTALLIIFIILFAAIGAALLVFAWKVWKKGREETPEDRVEIPDETPPEETENGAPEEDPDSPEK